MTSKFFGLNKELLIKTIDHCNDVKHVHVFSNGEMKEVGGMKLLQMLYMNNDFTVDSVKYLFDNGLDFYRIIIRIKVDETDEIIELPFKNVATALKICGISQMRPAPSRDNKEVLVSVSNFERIVRGMAKLANEHGYPVYNKNFGLEIRGGYLQVCGGFSLVDNQNFDSYHPLPLAGLVDIMNNNTLTDSQLAKIIKELYQGKFEQFRKLYWNVPDEKRTFVPVENVGNKEPIYAYRDAIYKGYIYNASNFSGCKSCVECNDREVYEIIDNSNDIRLLNIYQGKHEKGLSK